MRIPDIISAYGCKDRNETLLQNKKHEGMYRFYQLY